MKRKVGTYLRRAWSGRDRGVAIIESIIALALLSIVGVSFLSGLASTSRARVVADGQATGRILAESQLEYIKRLPYQFSYNATPIPPEYIGYSAAIDTALERNGQIQKLTVTITRHGGTVAVLEGYKANR